MHFLPPRHGRSLGGSRAAYVKERTVSEVELNRAAEGAWHDAVDEELAILDSEYRRGSVVCAFIDAADRPP